MVNGMYAFVLYDKMNDEYMVARDPFGIIPLYMGYGVDGSVWFSSEMKALQVLCPCLLGLFQGSCNSTPPTVGI